MPTAAKVERINASGGVNAKCKMTNNTNNSNNNNNANNNQAANQQQQQQIQQDTSKITNTIIEKKIRNLEKRKARLLDIKALEDKGQQLEPEQITAVKKLDSVVEMIEMLKEINKNVADGLNEHAKQVKKQQKKEQQEKLIERNNLELERIKLLLRIHKILPGISLIKENLPKYQNDTPIEFDEKHVEALETLARYPKDDENDFNVYAEKFVMILDGNKKEFTNGLSYLDMKELFIKMSELRIMDNIQTVAVSTEICESNEIERSDKDVETKPRVDAGPKESQSKTDGKKVDNSGKLGPNKPMKCVEPADLQKADPAVIACSGYTYPFQNNVNCPANFLPQSHPNQPAAGIEFPVAAIYSNVSMGGSIPTQTFTNQNFNGFVPAAQQAVTETARKTQQPQQQQQQPVQIFQEAPVMMTPVSIAGDKASMVYARDVALNGRNIPATNGVVNNSNNNNNILETATAIASNANEKAINEDMKATSQPENDAKNHDNHTNLNGHNSAGGVNVGGHYSNNNNSKQRTNNYRGNNSNRGNNPARNYPGNQNLNRGRNAKPFPQTGMFFPNNNGVAAPGQGVAQQPANFAPANNRAMNQKQQQQQQQNGAGLAIVRGGFPYPRSNDPRGHSNNIRNNNHFNPNQGPSANTSLVSK